MTELMKERFKKQYGNIMAASLKNSLNLYYNLMAAGFKNGDPTFSG